MVSKSWAASGKASSSTHTGVSERPVGSWGQAVERARRSWDGLTGGPAAPPRAASQPGSWSYSDAAAAAILRTALGLWADTAAGMTGDGEGPR